VRHLPVERRTLVRVIRQIGPEILPVAAWVGRLTGADAVGEFDERQLGAAASGVQMKEAPVGDDTLSISAQAEPVEPGQRDDLLALLAASRIRSTWSPR